MVGPCSLNICLGMQSGGPLYVTHLPQYTVMGPCKLFAGVYWQRARSL